MTEINAPRETLASPIAIRDLANTIGLQVDAITSGKLTGAAAHSMAKLIASNVDTLCVWTGAPVPFADL